MNAAQRIVLLTTGPDATRGFAEVNDLIQDGWRVANVCPMGGGGASREFAAVVVLERSGDTAEAVLEALDIEEELDDEIEEILDDDDSISLSDADGLLGPERTNELTEPPYLKRPGSSDL